MKKSLHLVNAWKSRNSKISKHKNRKRHKKARATDGKGRICKIQSSEKNPYTTKEQKEEIICLTSGDV